jgi:hypothetical protein
VKLWVERELSYWNDREKTFIGIYEEFSVGKNEMIWKKEIEKIEKETIVKIITEEDYRENLRRLMEEEERKELLLIEEDRRKNMNASPEEFADYLLKHNLWITKENYAEFCLMPRFKGFSNHLLGIRKTLEVKVYLPKLKKRSEMLGRLKRNQ